MVLFDEVEKGAPRVFDLLLQVMGEGRLTSSLRNPLAQAMLAQPLAPGTLVKVGLDGKAGVLKLSFAKPSG